jgi:hypothetical protein
MVSLSTVVDWIAAGTKVSAERHFRRRPFQIWVGVRMVEVPGGLMGAVKARLWVVGILVVVVIIIVVVVVLGGSIGREDWSAWFNSTEWSFGGFFWMLLGEYLI